MKIRAVTASSSLPDEDFKGLFLSLLSALMKANKSNNVRPLTFFFRERLKRRSHRAALNVLLNSLSNAVGSRPDKKSYEEHSSQEASPEEISESESSFLNDLAQLDILYVYHSGQGRINIKNILDSEYDLEWSNISIRELKPSPYQLYTSQKGGICIFIPKKDNN